MDLEPPASLEIEFLSQVSLLFLFHCFKTATGEIEAQRSTHANEKLSARTDLNRGTREQATVDGERVRPGSFGPQQRPLAGPGP